MSQGGEGLPNGGEEPNRKQKGKDTDLTQHSGGNALSSTISKPATSLGTRERPPPPGVTAIFLQECWLENLPDLYPRRGLVVSKMLALHRKRPGSYTARESLDSGASIFSSENLQLCSHSQPRSNLLWSSKSELARLPESQDISQQCHFYMKTLLDFIQGCCTPIKSCFLDNLYFLHLNSISSTLALAFIILRISKV